MVEEKKAMSLTVKRGGLLLKPSKKSSSTISTKSYIASTPSSTYRGVQMRTWGKWVTEVRDPSNKVRIWLGSFSTAEMAARAYDAAMICLKGPSAPEVNFPESLPSDIPASRSPKDIRAAAVNAATASVPAAAPLVVKVSPQIQGLNKKGCADIQWGLHTRTDVPALHETVVLGDVDAAQNTPEVDSTSLTLVDKINSKFWESEELVNSQVCDLVPALLKQVDRADRMGTWCRFAHCEDRFGWNIASQDSGVWCFN